MTQLRLLLPAVALGVCGALSGCSGLLRSAAPALQLYVLQAPVLQKRQP